MTTTRAPAVTDELGLELITAGAAQVTLLAVLSVTVGLGPTGWLAGLAYASGLGALLYGGLRRADARSLGPANRITLSRAILVGGVTALVATMHAPTAAIVALSTVALLLDAIDGLVARRTDCVSALGAKFDGEVDAFLILVLSVFVTMSLGPWVLAIGAMRYAFLAAGWVTAWLREWLPPNMPRKAVAAFQGIALAVASTRILPMGLAVGLVAAALASLTWSFGRDVLWLWRNRPAH